MHTCYKIHGYFKYQIFHITIYPSVVNCATLTLLTITICSTTAKETTKTAQGKENRWSLQTSGFYLEEDTLIYFINENLWSLFTVFTVRLVFIRRWSLKHILTVVLFLFFNKSNNSSSLRHFSLFRLALNCSFIADTVLKLFQ